MSYTREDTELLPVKTPAQQELEDIDKSMHAPPQPKNYKWLRDWDLVLEGESLRGTTKPISVSQKEKILSQEGTALSLKDFRFTFSVEMAALQTPWKMTATVYNMPPALVKKAIEEFTTVALVAGYQHPQAGGAGSPASKLTGEARTVATRQELVNINPPGVEPEYGLRDVTTAEKMDTRPVDVPGGQLIFTGTVIWYEKGRENATDTFLRIHANQYDLAWNLSMINTTLPAGHTQEDIIKECAKAMNEADPDNKLPITIGRVPDGLNDTKSPRARTLYGMPRDVLRDVAQSADAYCHVDAKGKINIVKIGDPPPASDPAIVVNSDTGMVGIPHQNMDGGMSAQTLLNSNMWPGTRVRLNEADITRKRLATGLENKLPLTGDAAEVRQIQFNETRMIAPDGIYMIWSVTHHGDTRGNAWYSDFTTMKASPPAAKTN